MNIKIIKIEDEETCNTCFTYAYFSAISNKLHLYSILLGGFGNTQFSVSEHREQS